MELRVLTIIISSSNMLPPQERELDRTLRSDDGRYHVVNGHLRAVRRIDFDQAVALTYLPRRWRDNIDGNHTNAAASVRVMLGESQP